MSVELQEALPPTSAEGTARKPAARCPPRHPSGGGAARRSSRQYSQLVAEIIRKLGERRGSSLARIYAEARKVAWFDQQNGPTYLTYSTRALVQNDTLVKGTGAKGSFKLNCKKLEGGAERQGASAAASPAAAAPKARKAPSGARADRRPTGPTKPERRAHPAKGRGAKKAAAAVAKKVKKAAKPSVPKVPKGRK